MSSAEEIKRRRFRILHRLYELTEADTTKEVSIRELDDHMNMYSIPPEIIYLEREGLIDAYWKGGIIGGGFSFSGIRITHQGIKEIEDAVEKKETPHFPQNIIAMMGQTINAPIQLGTTNSTQTVDNSTYTVSLDLSNILRGLDKVYEEIPLDENKKKELKADIETCRSQMISYKPKMTIIRECLSSAKDIISGVSQASASVSPLVNIISRFLGG